MNKIALSAVLMAVTAAPAIGETVAPSDVSFSDGAVEQSLTGEAGDPASGREVFADRKLGNCLACHMNSEQSDQSFHGEIGPPLDGVADRWSEAELRGIVVNAKAMFEGTMMPAFYRTDGLNRVLDDFQGGTILSAQQVEDVVAYLKTLKE